MVDNLGCLKVKTFPIWHTNDVSCFKIGKESKVSCFSVEKPLDLSFFKIGESAKVSLFAVEKPLDVSCFKICSLNSDTYIRFKENMLSWYGEDNNKGVVKYNTLYVSEKWSLKEIQIEELL